MSVWRPRLPAWLPLVALSLVWTAPLGAETPALSLGRPWRGSQEGALSVLSELPARSHVYSKARGLVWGTPSLVGLLAQVEDAFHAAHPGLRFVVGNVSRRAGGEIPWSVSHQAGRDADLGLILVDERGRQHLPLPLVAIRGEGAHALTGLAGGRRVRFDVPANWTIARGLVLDPRLPWVFVSTSLKEAMLAYARAQGEDPSILIRAEFVLRQPLASSPHDDHFHVRVYCDEASRYAGCLDTAPYWAWSDGRSEAFEAHVAGLVGQVRDEPDPISRAGALDRLARYERPDAAVDVLTAWPFNDSILARSAMAYLRAVDLSSVGALLLDRSLVTVRAGGDADLLTLGHRLPHRLIDAFVERVASLPEVKPQARLRVLELAEHAGGPRPLARLLEGWAPLSREEGRLLLVAAREVLNRRFSSLPRLASFLAAHADREGAEVLLTSLPGVCARDRLHLERLTAAIRAGGAQRRAAVRVLERMFGTSFPAHYSDARMYQRWYTLVSNYPALRRLPCDWVTIRRAIEGG